MTLLSATAASLLDDVLRAGPDGLSVDSLGAGLSEADLEAGYAALTTGLWPLVSDDCGTLRPTLRGLLHSLPADLVLDSEALPLDVIETLSDFPTIAEALLAHLEGSGPVRVSDLLA